MDVERDADGHKKGNGQKRHMIVDSLIPCCIQKVFKEIADEFYSSSKAYQFFDFLMSLLLKLSSFNDALVRGDTLQPPRV
jgi:hypothetical protein